MQYIEPAFDMDKTIQFITEYGLCEHPLVYALKWRQTDEVAGHVIFHPYDENGFEIGWVLGQEYWGKGIADEVTKALMRYSKSITKTLVIECDERQEISRHIALKNGFEYESKTDGIVVYRLKLQQ